MSVSSLNSYYTSNTSLTDYLIKPKSDETELSENDMGVNLLLGKNSNSGKVKSAYASSISATEAQKALKRAINELQQQGGDGMITFSKIAAYMEELEEEFTLALRMEMLLQGIPQDAEFWLVATSEGNIQVNCQDPEQKRQIENFFKDNPEMGEQFLYIQALGNLNRAQQSSLASGQFRNIQSMKSTVQAQALEAFFGADSSMGYSSLIGDFTGGDMASFMLGANFTI